MHASHKQGLKLLFVTSMLLATQASTAQQGQVPGASTGHAETVITTTRAPGPDSIAESANQQRAARKNEIASKLAASALVNSPAMPAIQVNAIPHSGGGKSAENIAEKNDQYMVLTEVLRSSIKSVAGISIFGSVRHVVAGDDLGNGWTVTDVDRFKVALTETPGAKKAGKGIARKTRNLLLGVPPKGDAQIAGVRP